MQSFYLCSQVSIAVATQAMPLHLEPIGDRSSCSCGGERVDRDQGLEKSMVPPASGAKLGVWRQICEWRLCVYADVGVVIDLVLG